MVQSNCSVNTNSNMQRIVIFFFLSLGISLTACNRGPKVIESDSASAEQTGSADHIHTSDQAAKNTSLSDEHIVKVEEVLDTEKYSYLHVSENGEKFWIAIPRMDIEVGETIYYKGGLMKKNFLSREYNRVFETLYLVSDLRRQPMASGSGSAVDEALQHIHAGNAIPEGEPVNVQQAEGSIELSKLIANKEKYEDKKVQVTGKVVKINPNIMNRNWVHLQDGSGEDIDLTITTNTNVPLGHTVTMEGTITLNKDFGAGYFYDIIMEDAVLK